MSSSPAHSKRFYFNLWAIVMVFTVDMSINVHEKHHWEIWGELEFSFKLRYFKKVLLTQGKCSWRRIAFNFMWTSMKNMWMNESIFYRGNTNTSQRSVNMKVMWYKRLRKSMYGCCGAPLGDCPPTDHVRKAGKGLLAGRLERELAWEKGNTD
jgi:hypothetical protein